MSKNTDVFIIGGGPAGLAAAIGARQFGFDVTIADGSRPPIDKACGEGLMPDALSALQDLGVNPSDLGGYRFGGIRFWERDASAEAVLLDGHGLGVRRVVLHQMLLDKAQRVGVQFRWETPVTGVGEGQVLVDGEKIRPRWIVGADGVTSRVRRWCGLEHQRRGATRYATRRHYRVKPWSEHVEIYWGEKSQAYVTPVDRESVCVVLVSRGPGKRLSAVGDEFPRLAARLESASEMSSERGAVTITRRLKRVYRENVALVGDASGSVDAITGGGLSLSFCQALALASAMHAGDLKHYQRAHQRLTRRPMHMARLMLLLDEHAGLRARTIAALAAHPRTFSRLLGVHVGAASAMEIASVGTMLGLHLMTA